MARSRLIAAPAGRPRVFKNLDTGRGGKSALMLAAATLLAGFANAQVTAQSPLENTVKAAYLSKLAAFVDWPASSFATPASPLRVCVVGDDPFKSELDRAVTGLVVAGRPEQTARFATVEAGMACQVAYIAGSTAQNRSDALRALQGQPVLTVTDQKPGDPPGDQGIVSFVVKDNRVRFQIDETKAQADHLVLSGKLLSLALEVRR